MKKFIVIFIGFVLVFSGCSLLEELFSETQFSPPKFFVGIWTGVDKYGEPVEITFEMNNVLLNSRSLHSPLTSTLDYEHSDTDNGKRYYEFAITAEETKTTTKFRFDEVTADEIDYTLSQPKHSQTVRLDRK